MIKRFGRYAEGVGYPIDVVKITNDLGGVVDGPVTKSVLAKDGQILCRHRLRALCKFGSISA